MLVQRADLLFVPEPNPKYMPGQIFRRKEMFKQRLATALFTVCVAERISELLLSR
jgi:hypothetical protein